MKKAKIVLLTVWFPPTKGVAVNRMAAFAQYLGEDFDLEVVTLGEKDESTQREFGRVHVIKSASIWSKIAHKTTDNKLIHHAKTVLKIVLYKLGFTPYRSWQRKAAASLEKLYAHEPFQLLISSYAPEEAHEAAYQFLSKHPEVRWIGDMRDEMASNPFLKEGAKAKLKRLEQKYLSRMDAITTVSLPILEDFKEVMPGLKHYVEIRNGYDHSVEVRTNFNMRFTVVYGGTFYGKRKPDLVLKAVVQLLEAGKIERDILFRFVGTNHNFHIPSALADLVEFIPQVPYQQAIEIMAEADCNLLINPPLGTKGQFSGKIFDYISVQKPILAQVDLDDVAAELIREHRAGIPCEFDDVEALEAAFLELYGYWKRKESYPMAREKREELHRKFQVEKMKALIQQILEE